MKKIIISACLIALPIISVAEIASLDKQSKFGVTAKLGTLGAGLDLTYKLTPKLNTRFNINGASADYDEIEDGVAYKGSLDLFSAGALLDYHPFGNGFRLSAGLYNNRNKIEASSTDSQDAEIGDTTYTIDGTLDSSVGFKSTAPYLGIGWGNAVKGFKNWHFSVDAGVLFQGSPESVLTGTGKATPVGGVYDVDTVNIADADFQQELQTEQENLNDELKDFKEYPVFSMGLSYSFK